MSESSAITMRQMIQAGAHFGHRVSRWNPKMKPYIYGARNGIYILNLESSYYQYERAREFIAKITGEGRKLLFVGTKSAAAEILQTQAQRCNQPWVTHRWLGGTLTNWSTIRQSIEKLRRLEKLAEEASAKNYTKKELLQNERQRAKLERNLSGIKEMGRLPGAMFVVDINREAIAVAEARRLGIPVIALLDTNCDPDQVDYGIPANDDAFKSIELFAAALANACIEGAAKYKEEQARKPKQKEGQVAAADDRQDGKGPEVEVIHSGARRGTPEKPEASSDDPVTVEESS